MTDFIVKVNEPKVRSNKMTEQTRTAQLEKEIKDLQDKDTENMEFDRVDMEPDIDSREHEIAIRKAELLGRKEERKATAEEILEAMKREQPVWSKTGEDAIIKEIKKIGGVK